MKKEHGLLPRRVEGTQQASWILIDYLDVVVHVFTPDTREFYGLERLWGEVPADAAAGHAPDRAQHPGRPTPRVPVAGLARHPDRQRLRARALPARVPGPAGDELGRPAHAERAVNRPPFAPAVTVCSFQPRAGGAGRDDDLLAALRALQLRRSP